MRRRRVLVGVMLAVGWSVVAAGQAAAQGTITAVCASGGQTQTCTSGWYTSPVTVVWEATPAPSATTPCLLGIQYPYTSDVATDLACTASWPGGFSDTPSFPLHVEVSSPSATATPARPPDANGWYNHAVAIGFQGSAFSGIASCTPAQTYSGPDTPGVPFTGSCSDNAGKSAVASLTIPYDATPPALAVAGDPGDAVVNLSWRASAGPAPLTSLQITRSPGLAGAVASTLYQGGATTYQDARVRNGINYQYTATAVDQAGNVTVRSVAATPGPRLLAPAAGVHLSAPPVLRWTPVPKAAYYNVQLYRHGKILSAWPKRASLPLTRTWQFGGRRHRLKPGRYRWYVWPGFGPRRAAHYGRIVGTGTFVVS